jgi:UDP-N-acetylglucosamine 2-epimerase (non-hydrolysing)
LFTDFFRLQQSAYCGVSDGGTITEEASLLDFSVQAVRDGFGTQRRFTARVPDYEADAASTTVVRIVLSYIDQVDRTVRIRRGRD